MNGIITIPMEALRILLEKDVVPGTYEVTIKSEISPDREQAFSGPLSICLATILPTDTVVDFRRLDA